VSEGIAQAGEQCLERLRGLLVPAAGVLGVYPKWANCAGMVSNVHPLLCLAANAVPQRSEQEQAVWAREPTAGQHQPQPCLSVSHHSAG